MDLVCSLYDELPCEMRILVQMNYMIRVTVYIVVVSVLVWTVFTSFFGGKQ